MTVVRLSPEAYEVVKRIAEQTGKSINEVVTEAVNAYYRGLSPDGKQIRSVSPLRPWVLKRSDKCAVCGKELPVGSKAMMQIIKYEDKTTRFIFLCMDCASEEDSLARLYLKKHQLEKTIRGLKKLADSYAEQLTAISRIQDFYNNVHEINRELKVLRDYLRQYSHPKEAIDMITKFMERLERLESRIRETEEGLRELVIPKLKKAMREA
jgi:DNA repair exonuclease SbcCD ATPase subunit